MKIALALICKDTKDEAELLDRCLENMSPYVDGIFLTAASKEFTGEVKKIAGKYNAVYSEFKWINDFSAARNFNFSQVPKDYDYIMWTDADDMWRGLDKLKDVVENNKKDAYAFWYYYSFDEDKQPVVVHKKTMIVRNDGSFEWKNTIHEDLSHKRDVEYFFVEGIERMHLSAPERYESAKLRNLEIVKEHFDDSQVRDYWNLGNAEMAVGHFDDAINAYKNFLDRSQSDSEKYLVYIALAGIYNAKGDKSKAIDNMRYAIGMNPSWPDAYLQFARFYYDWGDMKRAEEYTLGGLLKKPATNSMIVFNPRDYDYNPMMLLAKIYFRMSRPDLAIQPLEACLKINPGNKHAQEVLTLVKAERDTMLAVLESVKDIKEDTPEGVAKEILSKVPKEYENHPHICKLRNKYFIKKESTGKDVAYFCGPTSFLWNPDLFKTKGFGGSEEAVIHLSRNLVKMGLNVTVYNNCGPDTKVYDGVTFKPYWTFNPNDKWDTLILWRSPKLCSYELNADKVFIDLHDVIPNGEFTEERLNRITKVFVKSEFHKTLFPAIPEDKFVILPNGLYTQDFASETRDDKLIINTSSPDRSIEAVVKVFREVKKQVPDAKMKWAYGWELFNNVHDGDKVVEKWRDDLIHEMTELGIEQLGKIPQNEANKLYGQAKVLLYPTEFAEIDCISVRKAQLAGCYPITTDFAALETTNKHGYKVKSGKTKDTWCKQNQYEFAIKEQSQIDEFVKKTVEILNSETDTSEMKKWAEEFNWENITKTWYNHIIWKN